MFVDVLAVYGCICVGGREGEVQGSGDTRAVRTGVWLSADMLTAYGGVCVLAGGKA